MSEKKGFFSNFKYDFPASLVVFLVALPLCLGIALASEAPPLSGVIAGIVGGIIVGIISKSPLGVSGPAAGLASIVATSIADLNSFEGFLVAVVIAGFIQILIGVLRGGFVAYYFPNSVIKGMLAGIGVIIFAKQIPLVFGYAKPKRPKGLTYFEEWGVYFGEVKQMFASIGYGSLLIAGVGLLILILWERPFVKKNKVLGLVPGPLLVVILGIICTYLFIGTSMEISGKQLVNINLGSSFDEIAGNLSFPDWSFFLNPEIYVIGATIAIVASLETLLCVEATDKLDPQKRVTPTNRELIAQGTGNVVSGLIGGLPITQVIVRSSANIQSGGRTKASAVFHGFLMLGCILAIPSILNMIPYAALAAVLLVVGYKLARPSLFVGMFKKGWSQFLPFIITVLIVKEVDLLIGIGLGLAISIFYILFNNFKTPYYKESEAELESGEPIHINLAEHVSFLHKASILKLLDKVPSGATIIISAERTQTIHNDILEIIDEFETKAKLQEINFSKIGFDTHDIIKK